MFFPERRPSFLENANYFETLINLFFSRRIRDPQFGARATGKIGGWAIGALLTARDFGASSNRIASIDSRIRLNKAWFFDVQGAANDNICSDFD